MSLGMLQLNVSVGGFVYSASHIIKSCLSSLPPTPNFVL